MRDLNVMLFFAGLLQILPFLFRFFLKEKKNVLK